jgi:hypothetical protein
VILDEPVSPAFARRLVAAFLAAHRSDARG